MLRYKGLMIVIDGVGDRSCPELQGQTPLEAAVTPNLDRMARDGMNGLVDPILPGVPVGTHTGTGVLMGLAPADALRLARGPVEAAGVGLDLQPGEVVLRCNFATLVRDGETFGIEDRRAGRIAEGTAELTADLRDVELGDGIVGDIYPATQHRAVMRLRGPGLSAAITDTDPGDGRTRLGLLPSRALDPGDAGALRAAQAVNRFVDEAYRCMSGHPVNHRREAGGLLPANGFLTRGAGEVKRIRNLVNHLGLRASVIAGERTVEGLGRLFGFNTVREPGFSALPHTDLDAKLAATLTELDRQDLVFLHIKGTDICAHDRDAIGKKACIERIDAMLSRLPCDGLVVGVTGDHSTDSNLGRHCGDPVPSLMLAPYGRRDAVTTFGESSCMTGGLGRISGTSFLVGMLDAMTAMGNYKPVDRGFLFPR